MQLTKQFDLLVYMSFTVKEAWLLLVFQPQAAKFFHKTEGSHELYIVLLTIVASTVVIFLQKRENLHQNSIPQAFKQVQNQDRILFQ